MSTTIARLRDHAVTLLRAIDGTGDYTNDLTDDPADRVAIRSEDGAPVPSLSVRVTLPVSTDDGRSVNRLAKDLVLQVVALTAAESNTKAREDAALDIANDVALALTNMSAWTAGGQAVDAALRGRVHVSLDNITSTGGVLSSKLTVRIPYDTTGGF